MNQLIKLLPKHDKSKRIIDEVGNVWIIKERRPSGRVLITPNKSQSSIQDIELDILDNDDYAFTDVH